MFIYTHIYYVYMFGVMEKQMGNGLEDEMETGDPEAPRIVGLRINTSMHYPK